MEYRAFGRTGLQVSAIGFGCWELGGQYGHYDETEVIAAVNRALDVGVNCFDTAEGYGFGRSEDSLARALSNRRKDFPHLRVLLLLMAVHHLTAGSPIKLKVG